MQNFSKDNISCVCYERWISNVAGTMSTFLHVERLALDKRTYNCSWEKIGADSKILAYLFKTKVK